MKYFSLNDGKKPFGVVRYDQKRESVHQWKDGKWVENNKLFGVVMGDYGSVPVTASKAKEIITKLPTKTGGKKK